MSNVKSRNAILYSLLLLFASIQCFFIGTIIFEQGERLEVFVFVLVFVFLLASYFQTYIKEYHIQYESWTVAIWVFAGSLGTYLLRLYTVDTIVSTALVGLLGGLIPYLKKSSTYLQKIPAPIYCGAFIAMSNLINSISFILLASGFTCILYILTKGIMHGIGGKLGTLAFVGVVLAYAVHYSLDWI